MIDFSNVDEITFNQLKEVLAKRGRLPIRVVTSSMEPVIMAGDTLEVVSKTDELKKFDIIVFWRDSKLVVHYIWGKNFLQGVSYTTRSLEMPNHNELPVPECNILGYADGVNIGFWTRVRLQLFYG
ncbi:MAG: S24 family peptidase [Bacteriovoracaceae bacterium]|nr:S24 family peptidase [Bacteriovoracaceae bacterium]